MNSAHLCFARADLLPEVAHDGDGEIRARRMWERNRAAGLRFVDFVDLPPGTTIGLHTHGLDDEELYVIVAGTGTMTVDDLQFEVGPGDVVINRPGGAHGLANTSRHNLRIVVIDNGATPEAAQGAPPASN